MSSKFPSIAQLVERRRRVRLRRVMRGYRRLRATGQLGRIASVKEALTVTPACAPTDAMQFLGLEGPQAEVAVRQVLLASRVSGGLSQALLESVGNNAPVRYALPKKWRAVLRSQGFVVDDRESAILWARFCVLAYVRGVLTLLKLTSVNIMGLIQRQRLPAEPYVFFDNLTMTNIPSTGESAHGYSVVDWYLGWAQRVPDVKKVCHTVKGIGSRSVGETQVIPVKSPLPPVGDWNAFLKLVQWAGVASSKSLLQLFWQNWWLALMLADAAKSAQLRYQSPECLARDYLFHNSTWFYRPLWTYEAERKGARIIFYFYSTNCEKFKCAGVYPSIPYGWKAMSWPRYLVWDEWQADFVKRAIQSEVHTDIVGPIHFNAGASPPDNLPAHFIAVFDVQPMRDVVYQTLGIDSEYYVPKIANKFLLDIQEATEISGYVMILKRKRNVGSRLHPSYKQATRRLQQKSSYREISPDVSAHAIIKKCRAVISMPFTSTALIGRELGKPTVYYDPCGICEEDDRAAHGIPILSGREELLDWLVALNQ